MEYVKLNNGVEMPILGFGVYQIPKDQTEECVLNALQVGYRAIDTAQSYFNEREVGNAIKKVVFQEVKFLLLQKYGLKTMAMKNAKSLF